MQAVPLLMIALRFLRKSVGIQLDHPVVDGHKDQESVNNHCNPDNAGSDEQPAARLPAMDNGFTDEQQQTGHVPERHGGAESSRKQTNRLGLCAIIQLAQYGIDENRNGNSVPISNPMQSVVTIFKSKTIRAVLLSEKIDVGEIPAVAILRAEFAPSPDCIEWIR